MTPQPQTNNLRIGDTEIDPGVVKVMKAIRQVESSGGNYGAVGDGGDAHGAFQYNEKSGPGWKNVARDYLGDENAPMDKANQNKATYLRIKKWKDEGRDPEEIAALWNGAKKDPQTGRYVYNAPEYGEKFRAALKGGQPGGTYLPPAPPAPAFTPSQTSGVQQVQNQLGVKPEGLVNQLGAAVKDTGTQIGGAIQKAQTGQIGIGSGVLQGAGAAAGLVGTAVDKTIENTPLIGGLYKGANDIIGGAVSGIAETGPGQAAIKGFNSLSPEMQGNIGAAGNILSVIPFFKAFSTGQKGLVDSITKFKEKSVQKEASSELTDQLTTVPRRSLDRAESRGLDPVGTLVKNPAYLPDIAETSDGKFKWNSDNAVNQLQKKIDTDELALQNLLASQVKQAGKTGKEILGFNIADIRARTVKDVLGKQGVTGGYTGVKKALDSYFDALEESLQATGGRRFISLNEVNDIKRDIRQAINFDAIDPYGTIAKEAKGDAGASLMRQVEEYAAKAGIKGVPELNKKIGTSIEAKKILNSLNDKTVKAKKEGLIKGLLRETVPGANFVMPKTPSTATSRLKSRRPLRETAKKGILQTGVGMGLSNQLGQEKKKKNI